MIHPNFSRIDYHTISQPSMIFEDPDTFYGETQLINISMSNTMRFVVNTPFWINQMIIRAMPY